jgi:pseudouridine-5'-phosphate glycosidase/pseudouridine kinase
LSSPTPTAETHSNNATLLHSTPVAAKASIKPPAIDVVVAGALAVDFSYDYAPFINSPDPIEPALHTSNPAVVNQTLGGVAHNIAKAAHLLGAAVELRSAVGDDLTGRAALSQLEDEGMATAGIRTLPKPARTAQYVAINNANKDLTLAMADMKILENLPESQLADLINVKFMHSLPDVLVADANWDSSSLHKWLKIGRGTPHITTIFEPVSTAKALRIFPATSNQDPITYPLVDIITPNELELQALHNHAYSLDLFESPEWFTIIDALGIPSSGLRVPLAYTTTPALVDAGIPQQSIKLLPFFPTILTKLGPQGVLLTQLIKADDPVLSSADEAKYVLARCSNGDENVGGLYVRLYPTKVLEKKEVVSVNGCGDTFVGALAVGLSKKKRVQDCIGLAQRAAGLTLRSRESVSLELKTLRGEV